MIPKRIFYVWGADEEKTNEVKICMYSWFEKLKDYEIIEINENSVEYFNFQEELKLNSWFREVYNRKMYAYVSDYVRVKTLYDHGGLYLDTDVTVLQDLTPLLNNPAFVGVQDKNRCEPAILGAEKHNKFIKQVLDFYNQEIWESDLFKIPDIFRYFLEKNYERQKYHYKNNNDKELKYNDITILPKRYLIPFNPSDKYNPKILYNDTYTIHWYRGSWAKPEILFFLENKNKISLEIIDKIYKTNDIDKIYKKNDKYSFWEQIFSVKNFYNKGQKRKVIKILGIKFSFKMKEKGSINDIRFFIK